MPLQAWDERGLQLSLRFAVLFADEPDVLLVSTGRGPTDRHRTQITSEAEYRRVAIDTVSGSPEPHTSGDADPALVQPCSTATQCFLLSNFES